MEIQGDETMSVKLNIIEGPAETEEIAEKPTVMGRPSPFDKQLLVQELRRNLDHVLAVSGDGTNDAPAFHEVDRPGYIAYICGSTERVNYLWGRNKESFLPSSLKDLATTPVGQKAALTFKASPLLVLGSVLDIPPEYHRFFLLLCGGFLSYQAQNSTALFDFEFGKPANTPQSLLLSFKDACFASFPEMAHITKFMLCYFLTLMLVLPLRPGVQIFFVLLLISAPLFYFPELIRKASGVNVAFGSFKLPLIWFATLGGLGLSLICGSVTLLMVYLIRRFIYKGKPKDIKFNSDDLSSVILDG